MITILYIVIAKKEFEKRIISILKNELIYIENIIEYSRQPSSIEDVLNSISELNGYHLRLTKITDSGFVEYDSIKDPIELNNHSDRPEFIDALKTGIGSEIRYSDSTNMNMIYVAKKVSSGSVYRLSIPLNYLETRLQQRVRDVVSIFVFILLICLVVTAYMASRISRPLNWTIETIEKIKKKEFDQIKATSSRVSQVNQVNNRLFDVSMEIQQSIKKISKEKEKKDIILNNMINGLIVTNSKCQIKLMNQAAYSLFFNLLDRSNKIELSEYPEILDYSKQLLSDHNIEPLELKHSNGKVTLVTGSVYLEGKAPQGILIAQDITKLKRLESTRQQFVANVSHELKTPITYIRSLIETLLTAKQKGIDLDPNFINKALRHTDRLTNIIDDLLQLSKIESGEVEKQSIQISSVIDAAIQECQMKADEKNITLVFEASEAEIQCNYSLMIQAVKNLIENAIKFSNDGGEVIINCNENKFSLDINIIDKGSGIPENHIEKLFQRFYRVDTARSRELGGTGLGLSIVKHISQTHGGEAFVESKINEGSKFTIRLPI